MNMFNYTSAVFLLSCSLFTLAVCQDPCITDCVGKATGNYQSCTGCGVYATCVGSNFIDNRPCPPGTFWDDNAKNCVFSSTTCPYCVSDCTGIPDGDYNSCNGCNVYVTCFNDITYNDRPCPGPLVYDARKGRCDYTTSTC